MEKYMSVPNVGAVPGNPPVLQSSLHLQPPSQQFPPDPKSLRTARASTAARSGEAKSNGSGNGSPPSSGKASPTGFSWLVSKVQTKAINAIASVASLAGTERVVKTITTIDVKLRAENYKYIEALPEGNFIILAITSLSEKLAKIISEKNDIPAHTQLKKLYAEKDGCLAQVIESALLIGVVNLLKNCKTKNPSLADLTNMIWGLIENEAASESFKSHIFDAENANDGDKKSAIIIKLFQPIFAIAFPNKEEGLGITTLIPWLASSIWGALNGPVLELLVPYYNLIMESALLSKARLNAFSESQKKSDKENVANEPGRKEESIYCEASFGYTTRVISTIITNVVTTSFSSEDQSNNLAHKIGSLIVTYFEDILKIQTPHCKSSLHTGLFTKEDPEESRLRRPAQLQIDNSLTVIVSGKCTLPIQSKVYGFIIARINPIINTALIELSSVDSATADNKAVQSEYDNRFASLWQASKRILLTFYSSHAEAIKKEYAGIAKLKHATEKEMSALGEYSQALISDSNPAVLIALKDLQSTYKQLPSKEEQEKLQKALNASTDKVKATFPRLSPEQIMEIAQTSLLDNITKLANNFSARTKFIEDKFDNSANKLISDPHSISVLEDFKAIHQAFEPIKPLRQNPVTKSKESLDTALATMSAKFGKPIIKLIIETDILDQIAKFKAEDPARIKFINEKFGEHAKILLADPKTLDDLIALKMNHEKYVTDLKRCFDRFAKQLLQNIAPYKNTTPLTPAVLKSITANLIADAFVLQAYAPEIFKKIIKLNKDFNTCSQWIETHFKDLADQVIRDSGLETEVDLRDPQVIDKTNEESKLKSASEDNREFKLREWLYKNLPFWLFNIFQVVHKVEPHLMALTAPSAVNKTATDEITKHKYSPIYLFLTDYIADQILKILPEKLEKGIAESIALKIIENIESLVPELDTKKLKKEVESLTATSKDFAKIGMLSSKITEIELEKAQIKLKLIREINKFGTHEQHQDFRIFLREQIINILHNVFLDAKKNATPIKFIAQCGARIFEEGQKLLDGTNGKTISKLFSRLNKLRLHNPSARKSDIIDLYRKPPKTGKKEQTILDELAVHFLPIAHAIIEELNIDEEAKLKLFKFNSPDGLIETNVAAFFVDTYSKLRGPLLEQTEISNRLCDMIYGNDIQISQRNHNQSVDLTLNPRLSLLPNSIEVIYAQNGITSKANLILRITDRLSQTIFRIFQGYLEQASTPKKKVTAKIQVLGPDEKELDAAVSDAEDTKEDLAHSLVTFTEHSLDVKLSHEAKEQLAEQFRALSASREASIRKAWQYGENVLGKHLLPKIGMMVAINITKTASQESKEIDEKEIKLTPERLSEHRYAKLPEQFFTKVINVFSEVMQSFSKEHSDKKKVADTVDFINPIQELFKLMGDDVTSPEHPLASLPFITDEQKNKIWTQFLPHLASAFMKRSYTEMDKREASKVAEGSLHKIYESKWLDEQTSSFGSKPFEESATILQAFTRDMLPIYLTNESFMKPMITGIMLNYFTTKEIKEKEAKKAAIAKLYDTNVKAKEADEKAAEPHVDHLDHKYKKATEDTPTSAEKPPIEILQSEFDAMTLWLTNNLMSLGQSKNPALGTLQEFMGQLTRPLVIEMYHGIAHTLHQVETKQNASGVEEQDTTFAVDQFDMFAQKLSEHVERVEKITRDNGYSQPYEVPDEIMFEQYGPDLHESLRPIKLHPAELEELRKEALDNLCGGDPEKLKAHHALPKQMRENQINKLVEPRKAEIIQERKDEQEMKYFFNPLFENLLVISGISEDTMPVPAAMKSSMFHLMKTKGPILLRTLYNQMTSSSSMDNMMLTLIRQLKSTFKTIEDAALNPTPVATAPYLQEAQRKKLTDRITNSHLRNGFQWMLTDDFARALFSNLEELQKASDANLAYSMIVVIALNSLLKMYQKGVMTGASAMHLGAFAANGKWNGHNVINRDYNISGHPLGVDILGSEKIEASQVNFRNVQAESRDKNEASKASASNVIKPEDLDKWAADRKLKVAQDVITEGTSLANEGFDKLISAKFDSFNASLRACCQKTLEFIVRSEGVATSITDVLSFAVWYFGKVIGGLLYLPYKLLHMTLEWYNKRNVSIIPLNVKMAINGQMRDPLLTATQNLANRKIVLDTERANSAIEKLNNLSGGASDACRKVQNYLNPEGINTARGEADFATTNVAEAQQILLEAETAAKAVENASKIINFPDEPSKDGVAKVVTKAELAKMLQTLAEARKSTAAAVLASQAANEALKAEAIKSPKKV